MDTSKVPKFLPRLQSKEMIKAPPPSPAIVSVTADSRNNNTLLQSTITSAFSDVPDNTKESKPE